jgi:hypothetical protein
MKKLVLFFISLIISTAIARAQGITPCTIQAKVGESICLDVPCIFFTASGIGGTEPYTYLWSNGSPNQEIGYTYSYQVPTCLQVTVTDIYGCKAVANLLGTYHDWGPPSYLNPDTLTFSGSQVNFNVAQNDHPQANHFELVQPPLHGQVILQPNGTGVYIPNPNQCGPDYFRYTAHDSSQCGLAPLATVTVFQTPCTKLVVTAKDCSGSCSGKAFFYEAGALPHPLTFNWSNGSQTDSTANLCAGPVSVTVTDADGMAHVYQETIDAESFQAEINGPAVSCKLDNINLKSVVLNNSGSNLYLEWSGPGIYSDIKHQPDIKFSLSTGTLDSAKYQLIVRSDGGCADTAYQSIQFLSNPSFDYFSTKKPVCAGDTLEVSTTVTGGKPPYSYYWYGPNGIVSNYDRLIWPDIQTYHSGYYQLSITDANGCGFQTGNNVHIDSCTFSLYMYNNGQTYCSGSNLNLNWGLANSAAYVTPDQMSWTGPNGFTSNERYPTLTNLQPNMSGDYTLLVRFGDKTYSGHAIFTVSAYTSQISDLQITHLPGSCQNPDGVIQVTMTSPPPYQVNSNWGSTTTKQTNPFTVQGVQPGLGIWKINVTSGGCKTESAFDVPYPDAPQVVATDETCAGHDGTIQITSVNPISVGWWNGPAANTWHTVKNLNGLDAGVYQYTISDSVTHCYYYKQSAIVHPYLNFDVQATALPTCNSPIGALEVVASGQLVQPFTFSWSNNFTGNPDINLAYGGYAVTMTDGQGCKRHKIVVLEPLVPCFGIINGTVSINSSCQCAAGPGTYPVTNLLVCLTDGTHQDCTFTDYAGNYSLTVRDQGTYTINAYPQNMYFQGACPSKTVTISQIPDQQSGADLYYCAPPVTDLETVISCGTPRPGFEYSVFVGAFNQGTLPVDTAYLTAVIDPKIAIWQISPTPLTVNAQTNTVTWLVKRMPVNGQFKAFIQGAVQASLGDTIRNQSTVTPDMTDIAPANNTSYCERLVTGSYDPNEKTVSPLGGGTNGGILESDSVLTYTVHFQNTGTDTAFVVVVRDTLDAQVFDLKSVKPLMSSHPFRLDMEGNGILVFTFQPINLPDSSMSRNGSQGYVMFSVKKKTGLTPGTVIRNTAAIYFDYNVPVITPPAINTIVATNTPADEPTVRVFPNPTSGKSMVEIRLNTPVRNLRVVLYNAMGQQVQVLSDVQNASSPAYFIPVDLTGRGNGLYLIEIQTNLGRAITKIVKAE